MAEIAEEHALPKISQETRQKLNAHGFVNHLYDYQQLPSHYVPRAKGFDSYTYAIMGLSAVGAVLSKRFAFQPTTFIFAFLAAPFAAFIQKKQADSLFYSQYSKRNPALVLQQYPILNQSFKQVNAEVDAQILNVQEKIRLLEQITKRNES